MKKDQLPECYVEANDGHFICYVMEYSDEHHMHVEINHTWIGDYQVEEVIRTCNICGQTDVSYPV